MARVAAQGDVAEGWDPVADAFAEGPRDRVPEPAIMGVTVCALLLAERGQLDLDAPIAELWPQFTAGGKQDVTPRGTGHRAGLALIGGGLNPSKCSTVPRSSPRSPPGRRAGHQARRWATPRPPWT
jgi:CubicO group peptidase (beta-lactamase class C family)